MSSVYPEYPEYPEYPRVGERLVLTGNGMGSVYEMVKVSSWDSDVDRKYSCQAHATTAGTQVSPQMTSGTAPRAWADLEPFGQVVENDPHRLELPRL